MSLLRAAKIIVDGVSSAIQGAQLADSLARDGKFDTEPIDVEMTAAACASNPHAFYEGFAWKYNQALKTYAEENGLIYCDHPDCQGYYLPHSH